MRVIHIISGLGNGGAEHALLKLVGSSLHLHHDVIVLSRILDLSDRFDVLGVKVHSVAMRRSGLMWPLRALDLLRLCIRLRPDVIQTWMYHANMIGSVLLRPFIPAPIHWGIHHNSPSSPDLSRSALAVNRISKIARNLIPAGVVYCSQSARSKHEAFGYPNEKGEVIPNGFDGARFCVNDDARRRVRKEIGLDDADFVVGFVGRDHPVKGIDIFIEAMRRVAQAGDTVRVVMVGEGLSPQNAHLRAAINAAGLVDRIRLLGVRKSVEDYMNGFDVLMLTSWQEAFPSVLNEAMLCAIPCICTDVGDSAVIVGDLGWLVPPGDVDGLVEAVHEAVQASSDATAWQQRKEGCRKRIMDRYSLHTMAQSYEKRWVESRRVWLGAHS